MIAMTTNNSTNVKPARRMRFHRPLKTLVMMQMVLQPEGVP
jgi:hypothetical protein